MHKPPRRSDIAPPEKSARRLKQQNAHAAWITRQAFRAVRSLVLLYSCIAILLTCSCTATDDPGPVRVPVVPAADGAQVIALGNLRTGRPPTPSETRLAVFLFGAEPDPGLALLKPMGLAVQGGDVLIHDGALQSLLRWSANDGTLTGLTTTAATSPPDAFCTLPDGHVIRATRGGVERSDANGASVWRTAGLRAGGAVCSGNELWLSDVDAHRIQVLDLRSGAPLRTLGRRGRGPGEFGMPLGLAISPTDEIHVADMLNARVQVFSTQGAWLRDIGGPGDRIGYFGRPRSVAVGPDGTIFVVDAATQAVTAFTASGRALLRFGRPEDSSAPLALPAGICIHPGPLTAQRLPPADFRVSYYVLVSEQIATPGVRVYAWSAPSAEQLIPPRRRAATTLVAGVENPHWQPQRCTACHGDMVGGAPAKIARDETNTLCLSCHDGRKAVADPHPIGRAPRSAMAQTPPDRPLVNGGIGCLTCHDIVRHCSTTAQRPLDNPALVRDHDPYDPAASCKTCHVASGWRVNPHVGLVETGGDTAHSPATQLNATATCRYCHVAAPRQAGDGRWAFEPALRAEASQLCLNCHTMHADPAPNGHMNATVAAPMQERMRAWERRRGLAPSQTIAGNAAAAAPRLLPLEGGRIGCATCHNPHAAEPWPPELFQRAELRARSTAAVDAGKALRVEHIELCRHCHESPP